MESIEAQQAAGGLAGLFSLHRAELRRFLNARCGNADEAEDLLQDLWIKASAQPSGPIANGRAYLFRMASNLILDARRAQQRAMARDRKWSDVDGDGSALPEDRPDPTLPADEALAQAQEARLVRQAIATLPPGAQRALRLHRIDGLPQAQVAEIMGISRSGVEKHLAVAMKHLRNALLDCGLIGPATSKGQKPSRGGEPRQEQRP